MGRKYIYFKLFEYADGTLATAPLIQFELEAHCHAPEKIETVFQLNRVDVIKRILEKSTSLQRAISIHSADRQVPGFLWIGESFADLNSLVQGVSCTAEVFVFQHIAEPEIPGPSSLPVAWTERYQVFNWNIWRFPTYALARKTGARLGENMMTLKSGLFTVTQRSDYLKRGTELRKIVLSAMLRGSDNELLLNVGDGAESPVTLLQETERLDFYIPKLGDYLQILAKLYSLEDASEIERASRYLGSQMILLAARNSQSQGELFAGLLKSEYDQYKAGRSVQLEALATLLNEPLFTEELIKIFFLLDGSIRQKFPGILPLFLAVFNEAIVRHKTPKGDGTFTTFFFNLIAVKIRELTPLALFTTGRIGERIARVILNNGTFRPYSGLFMVFPFEARRKPAKKWDEIFPLLTGMKNDELDMPQQDLILSELLLENGNFTRFGPVSRERLRKLFIGKYQDQAVFIYQQIYQMQRLLTFLSESNPGGLRVAVYLEQRNFHIRGSFADVDWSEIVVDTVLNTSLKYPLQKQFMIAEPGAEPAVLFFSRQG